MATKIRLQRHGRKAYAFYKIVVADSRAPRDGKFIEKIGTYNPNTNPATVDLDFDRALYWLNTGAQPTDTARSILSHEGVLAKGAFDQAAADAKFEAWKAKKDGALGNIRESLAKSKAEAAKAALEAEKAANKAKAEAVAAKKLAEAEAKAAAEAPAEGEEAPAQEEAAAE